jgi:flagellar protein FlaF
MNPYETYGTTARMSMSDREVEAAALTKAASLLKACQDDWEAAGRDRRLADASEFNQKLWSIFQSSLLAPDHPMPIELRQNILRLSLFIDKRIFEIMADPAPEKLTAIIQISRNLAAGLRAGEVRGEDYRLPETGTVDERPDAGIWA